MNSHSIPNKARFRPDEAAAILEISIKTIYSWIATGQMEALGIGPRSLRIPREEIGKKQAPAIIVKHNILRHSVILCLLRLSCP